MDPIRFDGWTRRLHSRRAVVPALAGLSVGLSGVPRIAAAPRSAKKRKGKRFGCTKPDSICQTNVSVSCPDAPVGSMSFCAVDAKGKPLCVSEFGCEPCKRNRDCAAAHGPTARCVKCSVCQQAFGVNACVVPFAR
jgi:hypothetical protein